MSVLGIVALVVLVVLGVMVLRVKSDPREKEDVRRYLAESNKTDPATPTEPRDVPSDRASLKT